MKALKPLSFLYKKVAGFKNYLYDEEYFHSLELPISVVSIGNLTMGGTGKTPLTDLCLRHFQRRRAKVAVVSRNYRAEVEEATKVDVTRPRAAAYYGDEPTFLAERHPQVDVYVGPLKYETAQLAHELSTPQVIVVDDGFQHRRLFRDLDIVVLDATEPLENYECVPAGRARESWESLARADMIVITKVNLATAAQLDALYARLQPYTQPIFPMSYEVLRLRAVTGEGEVLLSSIASEKVMLVSALARPKIFEQSLKHQGLQSVEHLIYKDHHSYTDQDVQAILARWQERGQPRLVTTEKDAVKLKALWPAEVPLWVAPLEVHIQSQEDLFYEILDQALH